MGKSSETERLLERIAEESVLREQAECDRRLCRQPEPEFSEEFLYKMNALLCQMDRLALEKAQRLE